MSISSARPSAELTSGSRKVGSIFGLLRSDEDSLTAALGWLLAHDRGLCADILKLVGVTRRRSEARLSKSGYSIFLQKRDDVGRRDLLIQLPQQEVVIEAKIGSNEPSVKRLMRYACADTSHSRTMVSLTRDGLSTEVRRAAQRQLRLCGVELRELQWYEIIEAVEKRLKSASLPPHVNLFYHEFDRFIREDYDMHYYDAEVSIQDVDDENRRIFEEGWMYAARPKALFRPLYFAPHFTNQCPQPGIQCVARVLHVEHVSDLYRPDLMEHLAQVVRRLDRVSSHEVPRSIWETRWKRGIELIVNRAKRNRGRGKEWGASKLYFLGEPFLLLERPLRKPRNFPMIPTNYSRTIQQLMLGQLIRPQRSDAAATSSRAA